MLRQRPPVNRNCSGVGAAVGAFFLWGILPIFWKQLAFLAPPAIVAQRTLWSLVVLLGILAWRREGRALRAGMRQPGAALWQLLAGCLLASNWLLYVCSGTRCEPSA